MKMEAPEIIRSKKFMVAAIAAAISYLAIRADMPLEQVALITGPLYAYIGGQALADFGKEGAAVSAVFSKTPEAPKTTNVTVRAGATANIGSDATQTPNQS